MKVTFFTSVLNIIGEIQIKRINDIRNEVFKPGGYDRLWASAWFLEIVFQKVCVYVCACMYVCIFFCLSATKWTNHYQPIYEKQRLKSLYFTYAQVSFCSKEGFFLGWKCAEQLSYLVSIKVGMTRTYVNENEEQPRGFAGRIFKEWYNTKSSSIYIPLYILLTLDNTRLQNDTSVCNVLFWSSCLNTHPGNT